MTKVENEKQVIHQHTFRGKNGVNIYKLNHLGDGKYEIAGTCVGIKNKDMISSIHFGGRTIEIINVKMRRDAKGVWNNKKLQKNAYFEADGIDRSFNETVRSGFVYLPLPKI